jgi:hypothetical protein
MSARWVTSLAFRPLASPSPDLSLARPSSLAQCTLACPSSPSLPCPLLSSHQPLPCAVFPSLSPLLSPSQASHPAHIRLPIQCLPPPASLVQPSCMLACLPSSSLTQPLPRAASSPRNPLLSRAANPGLPPSTSLLAHPVCHLRSLSLGQPSSLVQPTLASRAAHVRLPIQSLTALASLVQPSASPSHGFALTQPSSLAQPSLSPSTYMLAYPVPSSPGPSCPVIVCTCLPTHPVRRSPSLSLAQPSSLAQPTLASRAAHIHLPIQSLAPPSSLVQPSASPSRGFSLTQPSSLAQPSLSPSTYTLAYPVPSSPGLSCPAVMHTCLPTQSIAHAASPSRSLSPTQPSSLSPSHVGQTGRQDATHLQPGSTTTELD